MNNKVHNKQISLRTIINVANYFEDYKERYDEIYKKENEKNKDKEYSEKDYQYENGSIEVRYTIDFYNGQNMTESNYDWFISNTNDPKSIKRIEISLSNSYYSKVNGSDTNDQYNKVYAYVEFRDAGGDLKYSDAIVNVDSTNQENEANDVYYNIMDILEKNPERNNKTIRYRTFRIQSFCISVGIILSYILYVILIINKEKIPTFISSYLDNKNVLIFGQWIIAIALGNILSSWYIKSIYRPLLPELKYAGYNSNTYKSVYKNDMEEYLEHSEVHIGKFWDAQIRREKIEKIYKITKLILLIQLAISALLFLILK